ncbi:MAG TPA: hypothetical protein VFH54_16645 [Mycobacteriales bacterium]|nr:hypothetical protein [Mycobacteriales bacterium]
MFARVTRMEGGSPESVDEGVRVAREQVLPRARQIPGWKGVISLADRATGNSVLITLWESEEAMTASAEQAKGLRATTQSLTGHETAVQGYEVVMFETD